jgi:hypothetical protein
MKFWFDTEFIEDGKTIDLISIGIVAEDGRTYYAENKICQWHKASVWVKNNVIPLLGNSPSIYPSRIRDQLIGFLGEKPEIWGYYCDYDWVAFCQLFGTMMDLPETFPKFCLDVKQFAYHLGNPELPKQTTTEHHALNDAIWTKEAYDFLVGVENKRYWDCASFGIKEYSQRIFHEKTLYPGVSE